MNKILKYNSEISFKSLSEKHFSFIHTWFNTPHIQAFYSLKTWTIEEVCQKLTPYIQGIGEIKSYVIDFDKIPIGYIQYYPVKKHPWENQDLTQEIIQNSAGIDFFIGDKEFIGKGFGIQILNIFLENYIWPHYRYCLADPDIRNEASMRLFKQCGFTEYQKINSKDALYRPVTLQLFIKENDS